MPAIRKPTNVLELNGSAKHDPKRMLERGDEPQNEKDIGKPPSYLSKDEKRWYNTLVKESITGVLGAQDRFVVAECAKFGLQTESPGCSVDKHKHFLTLLRQLGMTPAEKSKISIPEKPKKNPFEEFISESNKRMVISKGELVEKEFPSRKKKFDDD